VSAWLLAASVMLAGACGFDGIGARPLTSADGGGSDGAPTGDSGNANVPIDPDASPRPGCGWPTLQAGAPWPMLGGCVSHAGRSVFRGPHKLPRELWSVGVMTDHPVPSIGSDDTVYVPANTDGVVAFSPDGGSRKIDVGGGDVTNTPLIRADGTLHLGAQNFVVAQYPDGGHRRYGVGDNVDSSAVIDADGNIYVGSNANRLVSIDAAGNFRWDFDTGSDVKSSPAIGPNGDIYVGSNSNKLYALGKDGTKRWEYPTTANLESSPVIADDGTIYIGTKDAKLHAVLPTGTMKWIYPAPGNFDWQVLPALAKDGTIYAPAGSKLVALHPDGSVFWTFELGSTVRTPVIVDADGIIFVGADSKLFFAISPTGNELWRLAVGDVPYGFAIGRDGTLYVTCSNNDKLHALHE
jgi:outer membrane protein assembly factor BamB